MSSIHDQAAPPLHSNKHQMPPGFKCLETLGSGGSGVVYKASVQTLQQTVALKVLTGTGTDAELTHKMLREARLVAKLEHANLVKLLQVGHLGDGAPYLVYEYVHGRSLESVLKTKPLSIAEIKEVFTQLCDGLSYMHGNGLVHRDLKPSNIVLADQQGGESQLKILDFGIARASDPELSLGATTKGLIAGSPSYMSPEQCAAKVADSRSDIYSLGCILFECFAGSAPFQGESRMEIMYKQMHDPAPKLPALNYGEEFQTALQSLLDKALSKKAEERFENCAEFKNTLLKCLELQKTAQASKPTTINRLLTMSLLILLAGILVFFVTRTEVFRKHESKPVASAAQSQQNQHPAIKRHSLGAEIMDISLVIYHSNRDPNLLPAKERAKLVARIKAALSRARAVEDRFVLYQLLAGAYRNYDNDSALASWNEALKFCTRKGDKECYQAAKCHYHSGLIYIDRKEFDLAEKELTEAERVVTEFRKNPNEKFWVMEFPENYRCREGSTFVSTLYSALAKVCWERREYQKAMIYTDKVFDDLSPAEKFINFTDVRTLRASLELKLNGRDAASSYVRSYARALSEQVIPFEKRQFRSRQIASLLATMATWCSQNGFEAERKALMQQRELLLEAAKRV